MIDLHAHILPGLDDGAANLDVAVAMARLAAADGVTTIVATPHSGEGQPGLERQTLTAHVRELQTALDREGVTVSLVAGMEVYLVPDSAAQAAEGRLLCLGDSRYILVELPLFELPPYTEQALFELQVKGFAPILAHPERNAVLTHEPERLVPLVERGVLVQVTAGSLLGAFGRQVQESAVLLLERRLAHVIASDAHNASSRAPVLSAAVEAAAGVVGREAALAMVISLPRAILAGETVAAPPPLPTRSRRAGWLSVRRQGRGM